MLTADWNVPIALPRRAWLWMASSELTVLANAVIEESSSSGNSAKRRYWSLNSENFEAMSKHCVGREFLSRRAAGCRGRTLISRLAAGRTRTARGRARTCLRAFAREFPSGASGGPIRAQPANHSFARGCGARRRYCRERELHRSDPTACESAREAGADRSGKRRARRRWCSLCRGGLHNRGGGASIP